VTRFQFAAKFWRKLASISREIRTRIARFASQLSAVPCVDAKGEPRQSLRRERMSNPNQPKPNQPQQGNPRPDQQQGGGGQKPGQQQQGGGQQKPGQQPGQGGHQGGMDR